MLNSDDLLCCEANEQTSSSEKDKFSLHYIYFQKLSLLVALSYLLVLAPSNSIY